MIASCRAVLSKNIDIKKVWAQAWALYNTEGYEFDLADVEANRRDEINQDYRVEDFETSIIKKYFQKSPNNFMSNAEIMIEIGKITENKIKLTTTSQKIGRVMVELGYERYRSNGVRGWLVSLRRTPLGNNTGTDDSTFDGDIPF